MQILERKFRSWKISCLRFQLNGQTKEMPLTSKINNYCRKSKDYKIKKPSSKHMKSNSETKWSWLKNSKMPRWLPNLHLRINKMIKRSCNNKLLCRKIFQFVILNNYSNLEKNKLPFMAKSRESWLPAEIYNLILIN